MLRIAYIAGALLAAGGVLLDPYTQFEDTYSPFAPVPLWRLGLTALELAILLASCIQLWKERYRNAGMLLCGATMLNVLTNAGFVLREGLDRFLVATGTEQILSTYLMLLALRIALLGTVIAVVPHPMEHPVGDAGQDRIRAR